MVKLVFMKRKLELRRAMTHTNAVNELFMDIVFAAAIGSLKYELQTVFLRCKDGMDCDVSYHLAVFLLLFFPYWWNAYLMVVYANRFTTEEFFHNIFVYIQMGVNVLMAVNTFNCGIDEEGHQFCQSIFTYDEQRFTLFATGSIVAQSMHAFMFFRGYSVPRARKWALTYAVTSIVSAVLWLLAAVLNTYFTSTHRFIAISVIIVIHFVGEAFSKRQLVVLKSQVPEHFSIRMRKFAIVMLTQTVAGVIIPDKNYDVASIAVIAAILLLAFAFKLLYFDIDGGNNAARFARPPAASEVMWVVGNLTMAVGFVAMGASCTTIVSNAVQKVVSDSGEKRLRWLLGGSVALSMYSSCVIQLMVKGAGTQVRRCRKIHRVAVRAVVATVVLLMPFVIPATALPSSGLVWLLAGLLYVQVGFDMYGRKRTGRTYLFCARLRVTRCCRLCCASCAIDQEAYIHSFNRRRVSDANDTGPGTPSQALPMPDEAGLPETVVVPMQEHILVDLIELFSQSAADFVRKLITSVPRTMVTSLPPSPVHSALKEGEDLAAAADAPHAHSQHDSSEEEPLTSSHSSGALRRRPAAIAEDSKAGRADDSGFLHGGEGSNDAAEEDDGVLHPHVVPRVMLLRWQEMWQERGLNLPVSATGQLLIPRDADEELHEELAETRAVLADTADSQGDAAAADDEAPAPLPPPMSAPLLPPSAAAAAGSRKASLPQRSMDDRHLHLAAEAARVKGLIDTTRRRPTLGASSFLPIAYSSSSMFGIQPFSSPMPYYGPANPLFGAAAIDTPSMHLLALQQPTSPLDRNLTSTQSAFFPAMERRRSRAQTQGGGSALAASHQQTASQPQFPAPHGWSARSASQDGPGRSGSAVGSYASSKRGSMSLHQPLLSDAADAAAAAPLPPAAPIAIPPPKHSRGVAAERQGLLPGNEPRHHLLGQYGSVSDASVPGGGASLSSSPASRASGPPVVRRTTQSSLPQSFRQAISNSRGASLARPLSRPRSRAGRSGGKAPPPVLYKHPVPLAASPKRRRQESISDRSSVSGGGGGGGSLDRSLDTVVVGSATSSPQQGMMGWINSVNPSGDATDTSGSSVPGVAPQRGASVYSVAVSDAGSVTGDSPRSASNRRGAAQQEKEGGDNGQNALLYM